MTIDGLGQQGHEYADAIDAAQAQTAAHISDSSEPIFQQYMDTLDRLERDVYGDTVYAFGKIATGVEALLEDGSDEAQAVAHMVRSTADAAAKLPDLQWEAIGALRNARDRLAYLRMVENTVQRQAGQDAEALRDYLARRGM